MANYRNLLAWRKAHELAVSIYHHTENFPHQEKYGLTSQLRRAALSVPTNIVEGYSRLSKRELVHFIDIARGSLAEVEYLIEFASDIGFLNKDTALVLHENIDEVARLLWGLQQSKRKSEN